MKLLSLLFALSAVSLTHAQNPVVVELFTSQGCSSCPAADKNLTAIVERGEKNGEEVIGLSFHVDYWNYIGWKDPYSKKEFTDRQKGYAAGLNLENIYTPQMIVNGQVEFIGSDAAKGAEVISNALKQPMPFQISINEIKRTREKILITYSVDKAPIDQVINVALTQKEVSNDVTRGENSGQKLAHKNVVRSFATSIAMKSGILELRFSDPADQVVIFLQNSDWRITGAFRKNLQ